MSILKLADVELNYETNGTGDPLVLIPGFASGAWSWGWQTSVLAETFRVVTFDPRGIGNSRTDAGSRASDIETIADDIVALLDDLSIDSAHILGVSFGGFVALDLALRHADRVRRLILAATSFGGPNHVAPSPEVLAAFTSTDGLNTSERIRHYLTMAFSREFVDARGEDVERFCSLREVNSVSKEAYTEQLRSAIRFDVEGETNRIATPTLVISGDEDYVVPTQNSRNLAAAIPNARLAIIEGTGHMAFVEKANEFNRLVREFLTD